MKAKLAKYIQAGDIVLNGTIISTVRSTTNVAGVVYIYLTNYSKPMIAMGNDEMEII